TAAGRPRRAEVRPLLQGKRGPARSAPTWDTGQPSVGLAGEGDLTAAFRGGGGASPRRRLTEAPRHLRVLEERLAEAQSRVATLTERNEKLTTTLREARDQVVALKEEVDRLAQPPSGYGVFLQTYDDGTVDVFTGGRKLRVAVSPSVDVAGLRVGQEVMLNEALNVVLAREFERGGDVVMLKEVLDGGDRALVIGHTDEERIVP